MEGEEYLGLGNSEHLPVLSRKFSRSQRIWKLKVPSAGQCDLLLRLYYSTEVELKIIFSIWYLLLIQIGKD